MLVDRISHGTAQFTMTDGDLNALALACTLAYDGLSGEEDAATSALVEALGAAFIGAWHAVKAQLELPVAALSGTPGRTNGS